MVFAIDPETDDKSSPLENVTRVDALSDKSLAVNPLGNIIHIKYPPWGSSNLNWCWMSYFRKELHNNLHRRDNSVRIYVHKAQKERMPTF